MSLFGKIFGFFVGSRRAAGSGFLAIAVRCSRCGEIVRARVDLTQDLSAEYDEKDRETAFLCRKVLIGKEKCYFPIEIRLRFDAERNLTEREVEGGKFLDGGEET